MKHLFYLLFHVFQNYGVNDTSEVRDARRGNLAAQKAGNTFGGWGSAPDPAGGAYRAPQTPSWWGGQWRIVRGIPRPLKAHVPNLPLQKSVESKA